MIHKQVERNGNPERFHFKVAAKNILVKFKVPAYIGFLISFGLLKLGKLEQSNEPSTFPFLAAQSRS